MPRPRKVTSEDYNGSMIRRDRPEDYKLAVKMLGSGIGRSKIAQTLGLSFWTVAGIERSEITTITERRHYLAQKAFSAASTALDAAEERAASGKGTALEAKLLTDSWLTLSGEATQVIDHRIIMPELDALESRLQTRTIEATMTPVV